MFMLYVPWLCAMTLLCLTLLTLFRVIFRVTLVSQVPGETQEGMENGYELSLIVQRLNLLYFYETDNRLCTHEIFNFQYKYIKEWYFISFYKLQAC